jgi:hypothetical protein
MNAVSPPDTGSDRIPRVSRLRVVLVTTMALFTACTCGGGPEDGGLGGGLGGGAGGGGGGAGGGAPTGRCDVDLSPFIGTATGAVRGKQISSTSELIGGPNAQGRVGDFLLENERVRVVIQGAGRLFGPLP